MGKLSKIITSLVCIFSILLIVLFFVWCFYLFPSSCKIKERELLWKELGAKLCKISDFSTSLFKDDDACCRIIRNTICVGSYHLDDELEETCSAYNDFIPFMKLCLPKISAIDLYEITRTLAKEYPYGCSPRESQDNQVLLIF